jgi:hypothetical protein
MVVGMRTVVDIQADPVALLRQLDRAGAGADMRTLRTDGADTRANIEEYAPLWSLAPHVMGSPATSGLASPINARTFLTSTRATERPMIFASWCRRRTRSTSM